MFEQLNNSYTLKQEIKKGFLFFCAHFWHFEKSPVLYRAKGIKRNFLKFPPIPACVVL
jgi:lauroyl/myristoyl acyltransferase